MNRPVGTSGRDVLARPWHGWEYDLRTGARLWNPVHHLRKHRVEVAAGGNLPIDVQAARTVSPTLAPPDAAPGNRSARRGGERSRAG